MERSLNTFLTGLDREISVNVIVRDIDDQETWYQRYREYVPVLVVNDAEVCHYFFDEEEIERAIAQHIKDAELDNIDAAE
jgi:glutathione peroxidase-family protein